MPDNAKTVLETSSGTSAEASVNASTDDAAEQSQALRSPEDKAKLLARLVIREGKPFKPSAIEAGYAATTAHRSLSVLMSESTYVSQAIKAEYDRLQTNVSALKPMAITRLFREIVNPDSGSNGLKAIELAGRFKECDWFVRHSEQNLGVFIAIADNPPSDALSKIADYKD